MQGEDVGDGVGALVGRAVDRVLGPGHALLVRDRGPAFEAVAEDVEAGGGVDGGRHGAGVDGVADAEGGFQGAVGDAGFRFGGDEIEDGGACGFRSCACGGGDGDERGEGFGDGEAAAERGVDEIEELGGGEVCVKVHQFGGVDDGAAADGEECGWLVSFGELNGFFDAAVLGLHHCPLVHRKINVFPF